MDKYCKKKDHPKSCGCASKKIAALSLLAAVQTVSCVSNKGQGSRNNLRDNSGYIDLSRFSEGSREFKKLKGDAADTLSKISPDLNGQNAFFEALEKGDLKKAQDAFDGFLLLASKDKDMVKPVALKALMLVIRVKNSTLLGPQYKKIVNWLLCKIDLLLKQGTLSPNDLCVQDNQGMTPLEIATKCNDIHVVKWLVGKNFPSKEVVKALMLALKYKDTLSFRYKHEKIVDFLLKEHAPALEDLYMQDETGSTVLHLLIERGDINALRFLAEKLPLKGLLMEDKKFRTPMHLTARCKSPKMFKILFEQIVSKSNKNKAVEALFNEKGSSVFSCAYLSRYRNLAELLNNSKVQMPTFLVRGYIMFKCIMETVSDSLTLDQLMTIADEIDDIEYGCQLYGRYARSLRGLVWPYIEKKAAESGQPISRLKFHEKQEQARKEKKAARIKQRHHSQPDEGYESGSDELTSPNQSILTS